MASRRFPRPYRESTTIGPHNAFTQRDAEFDFITKAFWMSGVVFHRFRTPLARFLVLCLDIALSALCLHYLAATVALAGRKSPHSAGHAFITSFSALLALCVRFAVLWKRTRIRKCAEAIVRLNADMMVLPERGRRLTWATCAFAVLFPLGMMTYGLSSGNFHTRVEKFHMMYLFEDKPHRDSPTWEVAMTIALVMAHVLLCKSLPLLTMILCAFVFTRLRDINRAFLARLRGSMDEPARLFADFTSLYGRITGVVERAESALSLASFLLYGYMLSCVFSVTSYLVSRPISNNASGVVLQAALFVETVACFVLVSVRAAAVAESAGEVKDLVHALPARGGGLAPHAAATLLQLANNFASEVCVTGWGLFVINRGFILTTAGVVVTYGVILVQLGS